MSSYSKIVLAKVATVLTVYGIETSTLMISIYFLRWVATVLTVYGIETHTLEYSAREFAMLQQYLPFTVLKLAAF